MASVRGLLNLQSLNELTYEKSVLSTQTHMLNTDLASVSVNARSHLLSPC